MKTRKQEIEDLLIENNNEIIDFYDSITAVDSDASIEELFELIDTRVKLNIELHEINTKSKGQMICQKKKR